MDITLPKLVNRTAMFLAGAAAKSGLKLLLGAAGVQVAKKPARRAFRTAKRRSRSVF